MSDNFESETSRFRAERTRSQSYFYPNSVVLVNKLDIRDQSLLDKAEDRAVRMNSADRPEFKAFTLKEMQSIHKHLLSEVYSWAGNIRDYTTGRGDDVFARPELIKTYFDKHIHGDLKKENFLKGLPIEQFAKRAAHYASEINATHPFIDGNGRLTRVFIEDLAKSAGYYLDRTNLENKKQDWYEAMAHSFKTASTDKLHPLIQKALSPLELKKNLTNTPISERPKAEYKPPVASKGLKR